MPKHSTNQEMLAAAMKRFLRCTLFPQHSKSFLRGVRARFKQRISGYLPANPYGPGTARFDAFCFGYTDACRVERAILPSRLLSRTYRARL